MEKSNENTGSKNHGKRMKNVFDRLINTVNITKKRIDEF